MKWTKPRYSCRQLTEAQFLAALPASSVAQLVKAKEAYSQELIRADFAHLVDAIDQEIERRKTVS